MAFSDNAKKILVEILTEWAKTQVQEAKERASAAGLSSSNFIRTVKYKAAIEAGVHVRAVIEMAYYGNVLDRDFIETGKGISTKSLEVWLKTKGIGVMGGYRGQSKNIERQAHDMAWAIRKNWLKEGKRKGKKWDGVGKISKETDRISDSVFSALEKEMYEAILQNIKN